jgi:hypothetical protein
VITRIAGLTLSLAAIVLMAGCTTTRNTSPAQSAKAELLIATAADRAAAALAAQVPPNLAGWIDRSGMLVKDDRNDAYALAAIEDALLRHGVRLVADRPKADAVILPRAGDLSTDERQSLFGIPPLPVPVAGAALTTLPPLALYQENEAKGIAKFAASVYDPKTGKLIVSTDPAYGFSHANSGVVLFFITWRKNDMGIDPSYYPPRVTGRK